MKRKIALILSAVMILSSALTANVFAAFSDVPETNPYRDAIATLSMLETSSGDKIINGYEDGTFKPDGSITRAEFAKIITSALNYTNVTYENASFTDISDHWAKSYINLCAGLGIINGMGDGTFAPDAPVTYEQALKMVVCALGYGEVAESRGGYPTGYTAQASQLDLLDDINDMPFSDNAPRGVIAQVVYNALEVKLAEDNGTGISITDKTLLKDRLNVEKIRGTLVGIEDYVTSDCTKTLSRGMIDVRAVNGTEYVIDYRTYTDNINDLRTYLGQTITAYFRSLTNMDGYELIAIDNETVRNTTEEIFSEDIYSYSGSQLKYYKDNGKTTNISLSAGDVSIRYNGKLIGSNVTITGKSGTTETMSAEEAMHEWLNPDSDYFIYGTVKTVDDRADGKIDMIEIYDYEVLVAYAKPTTTDYRVQDKLKTAHSLVLDPGDIHYSFTLTKNDSPIEVTSISANDVILYAKSLDDEVYTVYVTSSPVTGTIDSVSSDMESVTIDGKEYAVSEECKTYMQNNSISDLRVGTSGTFYIDKFNTIVFPSMSAESAIPYAYISYAMYDRGEHKGYITAFLPSDNPSEAKIYTMASKVRIDGSSYSANEVPDVLTETAKNSNKDADLARQIYGSNGKPVFDATAQVAKIRLNNSKEVSEIVTLADDTYDDDGNVVENVKNEDNSKLVRSRSLGRYYYASNSFKESASSTSTLFTTNSSTKVIYVPMDRGNTQSYSSRTVSSAFAQSESYYVEAYDMNNSRVAGLIIRYTTSGGMTNVTHATEFSVVGAYPDSVYSDTNDNEALEISVYRGAVNTPAKWTTYDNTEFADVKPGDVIQFAYDNNRLAQGLIKNISFDDIADVLNNTDGDTIYDWSVEQDPDEYNNYQSYKFDYRYKTGSADGGVPTWDDKNNQYKDDTYTSSTTGTVPYLRAYMGNVSQVLLDENRIYVTRNGFTRDGSDWVYDEGNYEEISITSSTKIIRMESNQKGFSRYVEGTETDLAYTDLKDAQNYGINCSKVLICTLRGAARLIVIYE